MMVVEQQINMKFNAIETEAVPIEVCFMYSVMALRGNNSAKFIYFF